MKLKRILALIVFGANLLLVPGAQAGVAFELASNGSPYILKLSSYGLDSSLSFQFEKESGSVTIKDDPYNHFNFVVDISGADFGDFMEISFGGADVNVSDFRDGERVGSGLYWFGESQLTRLPPYYDSTFWMLARPGRLVTVIPPEGSSIPEPASLALLMIGIAMLGTMRRNKFR